MKRAHVKTSKSISQVGCVKNVTIRISNGKSIITSKASTKTK